MLLCRVSKEGSLFLPFPASRGRSLFISNVAFLQGGDQLILYRSFIYLVLWTYLFSTVNYFIQPVQSLSVISPHGFGNGNGAEQRHVQGLKTWNVWEWVWVCVWERERQREIDHVHVYVCVFGRWAVMNFEVSGMWNQCWYALLLY